MKKELLIAGAGGQGVIFAGKLLSYAALREGKEVTFFPSYGAEMRGGTANCTVIISFSKISTPVVLNPQNAIIMNKPSLDKFLPRIKKGGEVFINSSLVEANPPRKDIEIVKLPAGHLAEEVGSLLVANLVILAAWVKKTETVKVISLIKSLPYLLGKKKKHLLELNQRAIKKGAEWIEEHRI